MSSLKNTPVLKIDPSRPNIRHISFAAKVIRDGGLVAFPTETVYGLGANLLNKRAIANLYKVKARPGSKPFTVHIATLHTIRRMGCHLKKEALALAKKFWPGPLTMVLKTKGGRKIGFRMPDHKAALKLIKLSRVPVVAPSANLSGHPAPKNAREVLKDLGGRIDLLLDGGRTSIGTESTVVDLTVTPHKILREGAIKSNEIANILNYE